MTSCSVLIKLKNYVNVVTLRNTSYFPRFAASTSIFACTKTEKKNGALITTHSTNSVRDFTIVWSLKNINWSKINLRIALIFINDNKLLLILLLLIIELKKRLVSSGFSCHQFCDILIFQELLKCSVCPWKRNIMHIEQVMKYAPVLMKIRLLIAWCSG